MNVTDVNRRTHKLIEGRRMFCPRCKNSFDILRYVPLLQVEEYVAETNPVYKCPECRWIFSPAPHVIEVFSNEKYM